MQASTWRRSKEKFNKKISNKPKILNPENGKESGSKTEKATCHSSGGSSTSGYRFGIFIDYCCSNLLGFSDLLLDSLGSCCLFGDCIFYNSSLCGFGILIIIIIVVVVLVVVVVVAYRSWFLSATEPGWSGDFNINTILCTCVLDR